MSLTRVAIAGASGYSGQELQRLIEKHPHFQIVETLGRDADPRDLRGRVDLAFLCTPNEISHAWVPLFLENGIHVVDLSGAFRLKKHDYETWYGFTHEHPKWREQAEYALYPWHRVEPAREGANPRLIANPGCYTTTSLLAAIPLLKAGCVEADSLILDAKSGVTGAGRKADVRLLFSELYGDFSPYKVGRHQHWPEIVEALQRWGGLPSSTQPVFVTEMLPIDRGISVALFARWTSPWKSRSDRLEATLEVFRQAYREDPGIHVSLKPEDASLKAVVRTNDVRICLQEAFGSLVVFSFSDNLLRGAAGQALMNANQLAGYPVYEGLS